jgi:hypothetical protein
MISPKNKNKRKESGILSFLFASAPPHRSPFDRVCTSSASDHVCTSVAAICIRTIVERPTSCVHTSSTAPRGERDRCHLHHGDRTPSGGQDDLRLCLPSSQRSGVELARVQLRQPKRKPTHAYLALAYPVRHGRGGTRPPAARDDQDRTSHADEDPFKCFKYFKGMLQKFFLYRCCKSISGCCTCCNCIFKCMFQIIHLF